VKKGQAAAVYPNDEKINIVRSAPGFQPGRRERWFLLQPPRQLLDEAAGDEMRASIPWLYEGDQRLAQGAPGPLYTS
jgi:hypothetical protein